MIPVYILAEGVELPKEGTYYIVAKGGVFLHKDNGLIEATVKVDRIPFLQEVTPSANLRLPKLPPKLLVQTLLFFRRVYQQHLSEAAVLLHYSTESQRYILHCPSQQVSAASVTYNASERFDNFQLVGTIHSHASMGAFHSGVDDADERHFDGLHITIGRLDQPYFTVSCSTVVNSQRFYLAPQDAIIGITNVEWQPAPRLTYRRREVPAVETANFFNFDWLNLDDSFDVFSVRNNDQFYDMALPDGQDYRHVGLPKLWLDQVTKSVWTGGYLASGNGSNHKTTPTQSWRLPRKHERRTEP